MRATQFYRIAVLTGILSLLVSYVAVWIRLINDPVERAGSDFIAFYSAGIVAKEQGFSRVYDVEAQQAVEEKIVGFPLVQGQVLLFNHLPFLLPMLYTVMSENYVGSFYIWFLLLLIFNYSAILILARYLKNSGTDQRMIFLMSISTFLFLPLFFSLMNGQDTAILFLGIALWVYGLTSGREMLSGIGLSLTTVRPHISLLIAIPMLFSHRRIFLNYLVSTGGLAAFSVLILGVAGTRKFIEILMISAAGQWHGMKEEAMFNFIGLLTRTLPSVDREVLRALGWGVFALGIVVLSFLWAKNKNGTLLIGLTTIIALFTSPHLHFHDLTLLLIPLYEFIELRVLKASTAIVLPVAVSLLFLASNVSTFLHYVTPYFVMLAIAYFGWRLERNIDLTAPRQLQSPER